MSWRWTPEDAAYVAANAELDVLVAEGRYADAARAAAAGMPGKLRFAVGEIPGFRPWREAEAEPAAPRARSGPGRDPRRRRAALPPHFDVWPGQRRGVSWR